jgi:tetratricopeptide (TPR) repeat protein
LTPSTRQAADRHTAAPSAAASISLLLTVLMVSITLAGCGSATGPSSPSPGGGSGSSVTTAVDRLASAALAEVAAPPGSADLQLPPPQSLSAPDTRVRPLTGADLDRALLEISDIRKATPQPEYLTAAPVPQSADPPTAAIRAYVLGRSAYTQNNRFEAIEKLEQARRLDPNAPHVLRLLGLVYLDRGDDVRGAQRLTEALRVDPDDANTLFLLGRYAYQKGRWDEAIALLSRTGRVIGSLDPAVNYLRPFYLGQCLLQRGYDAAAIVQLEQYLRLPQRLGRTSRLHIELAFLERQRSRVMLQMGDASCRLGRFADAIKHYEESLADEQVDQSVVIARLIYANLALRKPRTAQWLLIEALRDEQVNPRMLALAPYVAQHSGDRDKFIAVMREVYRDADRPSLLALAIAQSQPPLAATAFLSQHLADQPDDHLVFSRLLTDYLASQPAAAINQTLTLLQARPASARQICDLLLKGMPDDPTLLVTLDEMPESRRRTAAALYLRGALLEAGGRVKDAVALYEQALAADEKFAGAQLGSMELLLRLGRYDRVLELLDKLGNVNDPSATYARARALAGLNRIDEATVLADRLMAQDPRSVDYRLFKARIQAQARDFEAAERTLTAILDQEPQNEAVYEALFDLVEKNPRTDHVQWLRLMKRVQREIPGSRIARLQMAEWQAANRQFDDAQQTLRNLMVEFPDDDRVLGRLVTLLGRLDRWAEAQQLLVEQVGKRPDDAMPLFLLEEVARRRDRLAEYWPLKEAFLNRQPDSMEKFIELARLYDQQEQTDKAAAALERAMQLKPDLQPELYMSLAQIYHRGGQTDRAMEVLDRAVTNHPAKAPDLLYVKAMIYTDLHKPDLSEQMLVRALEIDPEHVPSNNDLGYLWADSGRNLDKALIMTQKASASDPDNGAYLDSVGWALYKLGRFEEAAAKLTEARSRRSGDDPVILDHLGDALWRLGRRDEAVVLWREAVRMAQLKDEEKRPDLEKVRTAAQAKINAAPGGNPAIAPVPGEAGAAQAPQPPAQIPPQ